MLGGNAFDFTKFWKQKLAPIVASCGAATKHVHIETTHDEIVAIDVQPPSPCVTAATWDLELPADFSAWFQKFEVDLATP